MTVTSDLDHFYELLGRLAKLPGQGRPLRTCTGRDGWPERGVYFFQEPGEHRSDGATARVVRVGTHAVSTNSRSKLWGRLRAHRGSRDGRGNHRGSIFRLHVGAALLCRNRAVASLESWGAGASAPRPVRDGEVAHERRVSTHIGSMSVLWLAVLDEPGPLSLRAYIERNAIALLSNERRPMDRPSDAWLGLHSPRAEIRESGLWNLNHVSDEYDPAFLDTFEELIETMEGGRTPRDQRVHAPTDAIARICSALAGGEVEAAARVIAADYPFQPMPRVKRRYTRDQALRVFIRDGFIDRYTGSRLIFTPVLHVIHDLVPEYFPHHRAWKADATHPAFNDLSATIDHVVPVAGAGLDDDSNWVTTSMAVNFAKSNATLPGLRWELRPPGDFNEWDGLLRWFVAYMDGSSAAHTRTSITGWVGPARRALKNLREGRP